jgi:aspartyl aminopeptidase
MASVRDLHFPKKFAMSGDSWSQPADDSPTSLPMSGDFLAFLTEARTPHQFLLSARRLLLKAQYEELPVSSEWDVVPAKGFIVDGSSCLVAFNTKGTDAALLTGAFFDSPGFSVTSEPLDGDPSLNVVAARPFGHPVAGAWHDRCFRLAGDVYVREDGKPTTKFYDSVSAIATIPAPSSTFVSYPTAESGAQFRVVVGVHGRTISELIADSLAVDKDNILDYNLRLIDAQPPQLIGPDRSLVSGQGLSNVLGAFAAVSTFAKSEPSGSMTAVLVLAAGPEALERRLIELVLGRISPGVDVLLARSAFVAVQGTEAFHPNAPEQVPDAVHLGKGIAIAQEPDLPGRYIVRHAAEKIGVPVKLVPAGDRATSMAVNIATRLGVTAVSIGQGVLVPNSIRETAAVTDVEALIRLLTEIYQNFQEHRLLL